MSALAEGCIANIISFTSPTDACSSALVSSTFRSAADSDDVWEKFLPSDCKHLLSKSPINSTDFSSKKQLYTRLCGDPILLEGGNKSFNLEKKSGKKCITLGARELRIVWGDTPMYWKWTPRPDSRFAETAELLHVWWLEISGRIDSGMLSPRTTYAAYLLIKNGRGASGLKDPPVEATVRFVERTDTANVVRSMFLSSKAKASEDQLPHNRRDGWMEIEIGEFYNDQGEDGEVEMRVQEVEGHLKSGLIVDGIELRPKENST